MPDNFLEIAPGRCTGAVTGVEESALDIHVRIKFYLIGHAGHTFVVDEFLETAAGVLLDYIIKVGDIGGAQAGHSLHGKIRVSPDLFFLYKVFDTRPEVHLHKGRFRIPPIQAGARNGDHRGPQAHLQLVFRGKDVECTGQQRQQDKEDAVVGEHECNVHEGKTQEPRGICPYPLLGGAAVSVIIWQHEEDKVVRNHDGQGSQAGQDIWLRDVDPDICRAME